jgi:hypothetical protein
MIIYDLIQYFVDAQACVPRFEGDPTSTCPGTALNAITAAFATQGYWMQADILNLMLDRSSGQGLQMWAVLAYVIAVAGGIISMAFGQPPKMYLWFFIGPAIFHQLVQDRVPVHGVRWNIGPVLPPEQVTSDRDRWNRAQREVWKLAEPGLANTNIAEFGYRIYSNQQPEGGPQGNGTVRVAQAFVWADRIFSDTFNWFTYWTGLFKMGATKARGGSGKTNLPSRSAAEDYQEATAGAAADDFDLSNDQSWLLANLKWRMLEDITRARLSTADLRDAFVTFLASECGEAFSRGVNQANFTAAANAKGRNVPITIFQNGAINNIAASLVGPQDYTLLTQLLMNQTIPTPTSLKAVLSDTSIGSFASSVNFFTSPAFYDGVYLERIRCDQYLYFLTHAFRWQAGHIYYQMISSLPPGSAPAALPYNLFYGWDIPVNPGRSIVDTALTSAVGLNSKLTNLSFTKQARFLGDLILVHIYRNELSIAPEITPPQLSPSGKAVTAIKTYSRSIGSISKFGEVYQWALLLPYMMGILLYMLAVAFPFCCIFVVIPGWHKIMISWLSFFVWVKLWDPFFAICMMMERSVWAMIGNGSDASRLLSRVLDIQNPVYGTFTGIACPGGSASVAVPFRTCGEGIVPDVYTGAAGGIGSIFSNISNLNTRVGTSLAGAPDFFPWFNSIRTLDISMALGANMDLDLSNSYYIYIMAALYFAVPAVTGQLVLGAKAGAASLLQSATGGVAQEVGRAAGQTEGALVGGMLNSNQQTLGNATYLKSLRTDPEKLAENALEYGNSALRSNILAKKAGTIAGSVNEFAKASNFATENIIRAADVGAAIERRAYGDELANVGSYGAFGQMGTTLPSGHFRRDPRNFELNSTASPLVGETPAGGSGIAENPGTPTPQSGGGRSMINRPEIGRAASSVVSAAQASATTALQKAQNQLEMEGRIFDAAMRQQNAMNQMMYDSRQLEANMDSFQHGLESDAAGQYSQLAGAAATMRAQEAQGSAQSRYFNGTALLIGGAMGAAGWLQPGIGRDVLSRSPNNALAFGGHLGERAQKITSFLDPGSGERSLYNIIGQEASDLRLAWGGTALMENWYAPTVEQASSWRASFANETMNSIGSVSTPGRALEYGATSSGAPRPFVHAVAVAGQVNGAYVRDPSGPLANSTFLNPSTRPQVDVSSRIQQNVGASRIPGAGMAGAGADLLGIGQEGKN